MSAYSLNLTLANIRSILVMVVDIFVMWLIFYYALRLVRSNSRTIQIFKGIILIVVVDFLAKLLGLKTLQFFTDLFINWGFLAIIIIFQPEIREILERIGKNNVFSRITTLTGDEKENLVDQIVTAVMLLSKDQTGALISIEQSKPLDDFIATGIRLDSDVTAELLTSIFVTSTPLHDGAVIIQGDKIACASAYFPPTNQDVPSRFGARHRAAIGISEITDAVTIVVSEETGIVSIAERGNIRPVNRKELRDYLMRVICGEVTEVHGHTSSSAKKQKSPKKEKETEKTGVLSRLAVRKQDEPVHDDKVQVEAVKPAENTVSEEARKRHEDQVHHDADVEASAAEIKLPHKRKRPKPSYPQQQRMTPDQVEAARKEALAKMRHDQPEKDDRNAEKRFDTSKLDISKIVGFSNELDNEFRMVDGKDSETSEKEKKGGDE